MTEAALEALVTLVQPGHFLALVAGVLLGALLGIIPGLGGVMGLAVLLPFTFALEPSVAIALMIGLLSVIHTTDSIPAILLGIPGTSGSQATILDGYPLAKRGEAQRAISVACLASVVGGLVGTALLAASLPLLRPIVFAFGSPEFFMLGLMGITMVATLSGDNMLKGLIAAAFGFALAMVGPAPQSPTPRWTFGEIYLFDGVPLVPLVLGLFAIPEMIEFYQRRSGQLQPALAGPARLLARIREAFRDIGRSWFLVIRTGFLGTFIGTIPGLGSAVVDWFGYGHAASTERGARETFGKGDIRGVIAPESSNNSKSGGELIPTLAFGIPGSAHMAIFLGALTYHDVSPGPDMLTTNIDIVFLMVASIAVANLLGGTLIFLLARQVARVTLIPPRVLVILVLAICVFAVYQTSAHTGDLLFLLAFSVVGWAMKRGDWPRPPLVLAFVLAPIIENYVFISFNRFGFEWLTRPIVMVLMVGVLATLGSAVYRALRSAPRSEDDGS